MSDEPFDPAAVDAALTDVPWLLKFIICTPFGADAPEADIVRAHDLVSTLARAVRELREQADSCSCNQCRNSAWLASDAKARLA